MGAGVIATVGLCGTGKSVVTNYLSREHGYSVVYFGGIVLDALKERDLEINAENERAMREELREAEGMAVMAIRSLPRIRHHIEQNEPVVIDGLYSYTEYQVLREALGKQLVVVAVHAPKSLRYKRMRKRPVRPLTPRQVDERDLLEIRNLEKSDPIVLADEHLINNGSMDHLQAQILEIIPRR